MIRQIIRPTSQTYNLHIPKEYLNKEIEVLVLPIYTDKLNINVQEEENRSNTLLDFAKYQVMAFNEIQDPVQWQRNVRDEWDRSS